MILATICFWNVRKFICVSQKPIYFFGRYVSINGVSFVTNCLPLEEIALWNISFFLGGEAGHYYSYYY